MIAPPWPFSIMCTAASRAHRNTPLRSTAITLWKSATDIFVCTLPSAAFTERVEELMPNWSMAPVVAALQAMRGVALIVAVTVVAEVGDFRRFTNARQLMAYLGLVPAPVCAP